MEYQLPQWFYALSAITTVAIGFVIWCTFFAPDPSPTPPQTKIEENDLYSSSINYERALQNEPGAWEQWKSDQEQTYADYTAWRAAYDRGNAIMEATKW